MASEEHFVAVLAVSRSALAPFARAEALRAARDAGLVTFHAWPSGHWRITESGRAVLGDRGEAPDADRVSPPALFRRRRSPWDRPGT